MRIDYPEQEQLPGLRRLWKEAFGDTEEFLDIFRDTAFSPDRCRCVTVDGEVAAALYWLDCRAYERPMAYLYAVATGKTHRGKGICRALMADTHRLLRELGYAGAILVPGTAALFQMYGGMGYRIFSGIGEFTCAAAAEPAALEPLDAARYAALRREMLPFGGVIQEGENLALLEKTAEFYSGEGFLLCAGAEEPVGLELLGDTRQAPAILAALGRSSGTFRCPGDSRSFAMYLPLSDTPAPTYFGFAFD